MLSNNRGLVSFQSAMQFPEKQSPQVPDMDHPLEFQIEDFSPPVSDSFLVDAEMAANSPNPDSIEASDGLFEFRTHYVDDMAMYANPQLVAEYFDAHSDWFSNCAKPMKVEPLSPTAYAMTIGRFGALGYLVEPKVGLNLLPSDQGLYRIHTISVPDYQPPGYDVDFQSAMALVKNPETLVLQDKKTGQFYDLPDTTQVTWDLKLTVCIQFPKFIARLPRSVIQNTGDQVLARIVREVSRRLTAKVQEDFHSRHNLPSPKQVKLK